MREDYRCEKIGGKKQPENNGEQFVPGNDFADRCHAAQRVPEQNLSPEQSKGHGKRQDHFQKTCEVIADDVRTSGVFKIVFLGVGEDLLPTCERLNQTVESLKHSQGQKSKDKPLFRPSILAHNQSQEEGGQIGDQQQKVRHRLVLCDADCKVRTACEIFERPSEQRGCGGRERKNLQQNQDNQKERYGYRKMDRGNKGTLTGKKKEDS